jgi:hypothetical protein
VKSWSVEDLVIKKEEFDFIHLEVTLYRDRLELDSKMEKKLKMKWKKTRENNKKQICKEEDEGRM